LRQHLVRIVIGLFITFFFIGHTLKRYEVGFITRLDSIIYDYRLRMTMPGGSDDSIVILDIDEKSLQEVARWPWARDVMARVVDKLFDKYRIDVLGFDVVFAETDSSSGIRALDELARGDLKGNSGFQLAYRALRPALDNDGRFADAIKGRPVVLGYYLNPEKDARRIAAIPDPVLPKGVFRGRSADLMHFTGFGGNLPQLQRSTASAGYINPHVDFDGVVRRVPLLAELDGAYYEALSLAVMRTFIARRNGRLPDIEPVFPDGDSAAAGGGVLEWLKIGPVAIPVDETASALIPFRGGSFSFPYISLADVMNDRVPVEQLKGRIALVGTTAPGLKDMRSTPVESIYPGVEIHANLIAGMRQGTIKHKPLFMVGAETLLLLAGGVTLSLLMPILAPLWATLAAAVALALVTALDVALWTHAGWVLPLAASILMIALLYATNMAYGYFVESRAKRQFAELFGQYVPPELVNRMASDPGKYSMEPKAAELTILFSDVRGFTGISETLKPEELREYINEYLTDMSGIIRARHHGTLDKYIGDAIMAFWGAPMEDPQHARNGVLAGLEMQKECEVLNAKFAAKGWPTLKIGVGLNSGNVRVGDMGSQVRRAYTVMGDAVNVASRLEGRTGHYGVGVLVGETTCKAAKDVVFREIDRIKVKGKDGAVAIYEPIGLETEVDAQTRVELGLWSKTLSAYRAQQWDKAEDGLVDLRRTDPGRKLYEVYAGRIAGFRRTPPPRGWDGITAFDEK